MSRAEARPARNVPTPLFEDDPDLLARYLEDAAHYPGGHAVALARPRDADEVAAVLRHAQRVLAVGAQSSLTGGATPSGDVVLSTAHLQNLQISNTRAIAGAGVTLDALQRALAARGLWFPPVPTFLGATVAGAVSTNAAGAATFKYGAVREWVEALTVVLAQGDVLTITRGETKADNGVFELTTGTGSVRVPVPGIRMPEVPKHSAGYFAAPDMDLVDLFIGSEGTLGVIVEATLRVDPRPAGACWAFVPLRTESAAIALVDELRRAAQQTWRTRDGQGIDLAAIEHIDRRSLDVVRAEGIDTRLHIAVSPETEVVLLMQLEVSRDALGGDLWAELADVRSPGAADTALVRFCRVLDRHGALDEVEIVLPSNTGRAAALTEFREAVPAGVNRLVARAHHQDARIHKTAADMIVPFDRFEDMMRVCRALFARQHLDLAVWGHISDGNVHPNVIPQTFDDVERGRAAILELGREVVAMGGCPLAEHGVGRNPVKQQLLRLLYGDAGIDAMRAVKRSLDPQLKLARGVLFE